VVTFARDTATFVPVRGITAAAQPDLEGVVAEDRLVPFGGTGVTGALQERVVRSNVDSTLAFYYRITELNGPGVLTYIALSNWPIVGSLDGDYRLDGLGDRGPQQVGCSPGDIYFRFYLDTPRTLLPVTPGALSRFMFIKLLPPDPGNRLVTEYNRGGRITLGSETWADILIDAFIPTV
jgi:hypothetical protein